MVPNWFHITVSEHLQYCNISIKLQMQANVKVNLLMPKYVLILWIWALDGWMNIIYIIYIAAVWNVGID